MSQPPPVDAVSAMGELWQTTGWCVSQAFPHDNEHEKHEGGTCLANGLAVAAYLVLSH